MKGNQMSEENTSPAALKGLKVLDLSRVLAGPWATQMLADLGADVVKVESPVRGDDTRSWGPPFIKKIDGEQGEAAYFTCCNRNKKSITVDFSTPEGAELVRKLSVEADVVVENFKVGSLKKYGLDYQSIKNINPKIIYCSISGFGQTGPYSHRLGYDFLIQGMGGLMSITGKPDSVEGGEPMKVGVAICDLFTGMNAGASILAALHYRNQTGIGQQIDCSLLDNQISMLANQASSWLNGNTLPNRMGNSHPTVVPYRVFATLDGHVVITCGNDGQFRRLCGVLGVAELGVDPKYRTNDVRILNREELESHLQSILSTKGRNKILGDLEKVDVPCGPINTLTDVFSDPHVVYREMQVDMERPDGTLIKTVAFPTKLSKSPATYRNAPPSLGENTDEVLMDWINLDKERISIMRKTGII
jgi:crotonobetainyl-CoA:carnitine CoA-transferase CaiB-like acyl-CoA transferase